MSAKIQGLTLKKRRGHFYFCAVKCKKDCLALKLLGFTIYLVFDFGRYIRRKIGPTQSVSSIFLRETFYIDYLDVFQLFYKNIPWRTWTRLVQKKRLFYFFLQSNAYQSLTSLTVGTHFRC